MSLDLDFAREKFESSQDFTIGLEEEFAILDPRTLELEHRFEDVIAACRQDDVLAEAAKACKQRLVAIPEHELHEHAARALGVTAVALTKKISTLGKSAGPPWGKDQKDAALAAMVALAGPTGPAPGHSARV